MHNVKPESKIMYNITKITVTNPFNTEAVPQSPCASVDALFAVYI